MQRKARICHIFKITGVSGSENHLLTLASHLDRSRYLLTFCLLVEREPDLSAYIATLEAIGVEVVRFPIRADLDPLLLWRLVRFLCVQRPDAFTPISFTAISTAHWRPGWPGCRM